MAGGERRDGGILNGVRKWWREKTGFGILGSVLEEAGSGIETGAPPRKEAVQDQAISPSLGAGDCMLSICVLPAKLCLASMGA